MNKLNPQSTRRPHYRQAKKWARYARILREVRFGAHQRKEEALAWSLDKARTFVLPSLLECEPEHERGLRLLENVAEAVRFPELEAKAVYDDAAEAERVELYVHYATRRGTEKAPVGCLPAYDAQWMLPLLRDAEAKKWLQIFVLSAERCAAEVVITRAHVAAHYWMDGYDDRRAAVETKRGGTEQERAVAAYVKTHRSGGGAEDVGQEIARLRREINQALVEINAREEVGLPADKKEAYVAGLAAQIASLRQRSHRSQAERVGAPTVEDWLREDVGLREVPFTKLSKEDKRAVERQGVEVSWS